MMKIKTAALLALVADSMVGEKRSWKKVATVRKMLLLSALYLALLSILRGYSICRAIGDYRNAIYESMFREPSLTPPTTPWPLSTRRSIIDWERESEATLSLRERRYLFNPSNALHSKPTSRSRKVPRSVALETPTENNLRSGGSQPTTDKKWEKLICCSVPSNPPRIDQSWYIRNANKWHGYEDSSSCEPMHDWQLQSYQNCNTFHELDYHQTRMINSGGARIAFEMNQHLDNREMKFVYKTIKPGRKIIEKQFDEQRRDALIMERTSSSQFIPDVHGNCGLAVMMDYMPEGNMHDYIKGARLAGGSTLPSVDKLRISIHIASGVADLHTKALFFHNDVFSHQFLFQDNIFKLNDFNIAGPIYVNKTNNKPCTREKYESNGYIWKGRSLEEFQRLSGYKEYTPSEPTKVDIWMMGNLIYTILTDLYLFEEPNLGKVKAAYKLVSGERSPIPKHISSSSDPSIAAIMKALDMCWTYKWQERPSAQLVSTYLLDQLKEISGQEHPDLRVELPGRDPNQRGTDSDFVHFNCDHSADGSVKKNCM